MQGWGKRYAYEYHSQMATWSAWGSSTGSRLAAQGGGSVDQTSTEEKVLQQQRLDELVGLLLGAGYFRARLPRLPPFDKVCGGCVDRLHWE
jgi:hypothetical protein